jgi:hypothetical protein
MTHEAIWNSRPRKYGKGSRGWYFNSHLSSLLFPPSQIPILRPISILSPLPADPPRPIDPVHSQDAHRLVGRSVGALEDEN